MCPQARADWSFSALSQKARPWSPEPPGLPFELALPSWFRMTPSPLPLPSAVNRPGAVAGYRIGHHLGTAQLGAVLSVRSRRRGFHRYRPSKVGAVDQYQFAAHFVSYAPPSFIRFQNGSTCSFLSSPSFMKAMKGRATRLPRSLSTITSPISSAPYWTISQLALS